MSTASEMSTAVPVRHRGLRVAYVFAGSTGAWMAHLFFASSFVRYSCNAHGSGWYQHLATAICAAVAAHATWVAYRLHREGRVDREDAGTARRGIDRRAGVGGVDGGRVGAPGGSHGAVAPAPRLSGRRRARPPARSRAPHDAGDRCLLLVGGIQRGVESGGGGDRRPVLHHR